MVNGNATGDVMFYGKGAGKLATASAVVADMLDCIEHADHRRRISWGDGSKICSAADTLQSAWYVRFKGESRDLEALLPVESLTEPVTAWWWSRHASCPPRICRKRSKN